MHGIHDPSLSGLALPPTLGLSPPTIESILLGSAGPPRFAERLATIERLTVSLEARAAQRLAELRRTYGAGSPLAAARLRREIESWDLDEVNTLIAAHNRYYPIERRLPMDPLTGDYVAVGGRSYRREPLEAQRLAALAAAQETPAVSTASRLDRRSAPRAAAAPATPASAHPKA
jgi:hypothetical protein